MKTRTFLLCLATLLIAFACNKSSKKLTDSVKKETNDPVKEVKEVSDEKLKPISISKILPPPTDIKYPESKKGDVSDDYHGKIVADPYRWLEDDTAEDVAAWVTAQNEVTQGYLSKVPYREKIETRYTELFNYPKLSSPFKAGDYYFFYKNDGLQNQAVIFYQKGLDGEPSVFLDPNKLSDEGTVAITLVGFSKDNKYVAYSRQEAGSDWQSLHVMEVASRKKTSDVLKWVKFSGASWKGDGFYYSRYPAPEEGTEFSAANQFHRVYYHKLGDAQEKDELIYENTADPKLYHGVSTTEDERYLLLYAYQGTEGNELSYMDLEKKGDFIPLIKGFKNKNYNVHNQGNQLMVITNIDAPKYRLVNIDLANPSKSAWKDIIPEKENLLQGVNAGGGKLFANYLRNATTQIFSSNYDGSNSQEIKLPGLGSAGGFSGKENDKTLFYTFTSFLYPGAIFSYDVATGTSKEFYEAELKFDPKDYEEKQVFYKSKDGTEVSMFLVHKKGLTLDGNNTAYLYGYGGFNVSLSPWFSASRIVLLENGGVFAMPNLRGGGEYGEEWHKQGMLLKKQNVFNDFISAAQYLVDEGYTSKKKLAIAGGSNGGLLVGACMTQRPDMFAVALPAVGVMDMLRYHKFTVGWGWVPEYGSSDDPVHFTNLYGYSPLHNLRPEVKYPSTFVTTADHDDRVVPAHSFKFAAQLQEYHKGENPVLISIAVDAGHGAGKPTSKIIEEQADMWSFIFWNTDTKVVY